MKAKNDLRRGGSSAYGEQDVKGKKLVPEKKIKNAKKALFDEIEEDEDIDLFVEEKESVEDYFDDENEFDEDFDEEEE